MGNQANNNNAKQTDEFIIRHSHNSKNQIPDNTIQSTVDQRRLVFVNSIGLYQSWERVPSHLLYTSLLILPLKKTWVYHHSDCIQTLQNKFISEECKDNSEIDPRFIDFLKWKDSQGLIMWCLDHFDGSVPKSTKHTIESHINPLIASFWCRFSEKLCCLYDHITGENYKPLNLDEQWWANKGEFISKYGTKSSEILAEFYFVTMKCNTMCEIIYQSNPKTLHPIIEYRDRKLQDDFSNNSAMTPLSPIKENNYEIAYLNIRKQVNVPK